MIDGIKANVMWYLREQISDKLCQIRLSAVEFVY